MNALKLRPLTAEDQDWIADLLKEHWGSVMMVVRGWVFRSDELPGFVAEIEGKRVGLITYLLKSKECVVMSINSLEEGKGVGTALVEEIKRTAKEASCRRLWLITTNDNTHALRFWQKQGFKIKAVYPNAIEKSRKMKPEIPLVGNDGIPIRDEIELEIIL